MRMKRRREEGAEEGEKNRTTDERTKKECLELLPFIQIGDQVELGGQLT